MSKTSIGSLGWGKEGIVEQYVFVRLLARAGQESAVEEALREVTGPSREEPGCLSFHLFRSMRERRLFYIHSRWMDEAAFQRHAELAHTKRFLERVDALLEQPREVARAHRSAQVRVFASSFRPLSTDGFNLTG
jgi:quinol monooxygenase YgiN